MKSRTSVQKFWPFPLVALGTILAIFGTSYSGCNCGVLSLTCASCHGVSSSPNYTLNLIGLIMTVMFTFAFVLTSTARAHPMPEMAVG